MEDGQFMEEGGMKAGALPEVLNGECMRAETEVSGKALPAAVSPDTGESAGEGTGAAAGERPGEALKQVSAGKTGEKEAKPQAEGLMKVFCVGDEKVKRCSAGEEERTDPAYSLRREIAGIFPGRRQDIRSYSALSLAYIGDVVYDLIIRTVVVGKGNRPVNDLHRITVKYVSATAQAKIVQALSETLTEEEKTIFQRGKNAKPHTTAKNASVSDYLKATGFEAVIGYLYLTDNMERALELVKKGIALAGMEI